MTKTLLDVLRQSAEKYPNNPFLWEKRNGTYQCETFSEIEKKASRFGAGLRALGIEKGDRIALFGEGKNNWVIAELGIFYAGGICVPLSIKLDAASDLIFRLNHSESNTLIVSKTQLHKIRAIKADLTHIKRYIILENTTDYEQDELSFDFILSKGSGYLSENVETFQTHLDAITPDDIVNISYTSGTTDNPKGIMLSHKNYVTNVQQSMTHMGGIPTHYRTLLILPWDHSFAHTTGVFLFMAAGASIAAVETGNSPMESLRNIPKNLKEINPDVLLSVPALASNFKKNIESAVQKKGKFTQFLFQTALKVAYSYQQDGHNRGKGLSFLWKPIHAFFDAILFSKIRHSFSSNLKFFVGGGALLDIEFQRFFMAIGIPMLQGYGLSEASPVISSNSLKAHKLGSSGKPVPNMEIKISDPEGKALAAGQEGEIVIKGGNVMAGYWQNEQATAQTLKNGFLHTGDRGYIDPDGFLYVLGRFKSLLISNDGEKFSPEGIEEALVNASPLIQQCVLYNNQSPYTVALLTIDREGVRKSFAKLNSVEEVLNLFVTELAAYRKDGKYSHMFPERWIPSSFALLAEPFSEKNGLVNSTMKIMRHKVVEKYQARINELYSPEGKQDAYKQNIDILRQIVK